MKQSLTLRRCELNRQEREMVESELLELHRRFPEAGRLDLLLEGDGKRFLAHLQTRGRGGFNTTVHGFDPIYCFQEVVERAHNYLSRRRRKIRDWRHHHHRRRLQFEELPAY